MGGFFDSLYSQFLLRDLLAKVVPGFIALAAISALVIHSPLELVERLSGVHSIVTIGILYGISFMVGMFLQFIGERIRFVVIFVWRDNDEIDAREESLRRFQEFLSDEALSVPIYRQRERFAILKEMSGNFGMSLLSVSVVALFRSVPAKPSIQAALLVGSIVLVSISFLLFRQNRFHAQEQLIWEKDFIERDE